MNSDVHLTLFAASKVSTTSLGLHGSCSSHSPYLETHGTLLPVRSGHQKEHSEAIARGWEELGSLLQIALPLNLIPQRAQVIS